MIRKSTESFDKLPSIELTIKIAFTHEEIERGETSKISALTRREKLITRREA